MRLYLDDDTASPLLAKRLRKAAHDVLMPGEVGMSGSDDAENAKSQEPFRGICGGLEFCY